MRAYVLSILAAALLAAIVERLTPKGEGDRIASHIRMVAGLFLLVTLLTPLTEGLRLLRDGLEGDLAARVESWLPEPSQEGYEAVFGDTLTGISQDQLRDYFFTTMENQFSIPPTGCRVSVDCTYSEGRVTVSEVRICLLDQYALQDPHAIEDYFSEQLGCPCFVTVELS